MAYTWDSSLETGNTAIDNQHKQLFAAVNALYDAHKEGKGQAEVEKTMDFLLAYTIKHFADEEKLQEKYLYPGFLAHRQTHVDFKTTASRLARELSETGPTDEYISRVYALIGDWLVNHIKGDDFGMAAFVRNKEKEAIGK
ncbi:MAG: bacteriohemerythrin [Desulfovibrionaceae bacterium]|nr:bacteriohemerythrin [Desulfovibrionaceae bacterium]